MRVLFGAQDDSVQQLASQIQCTQQEVLHHDIVKDMEDSFGWIGDGSGKFSLNSCYKGFLKEQLETRYYYEILLQFKRLWSTKVLSKIQIFSWRMLINQLPSKKELAKRRLCSQ